MLVTLLFLLLVKHFICDFGIQGKYPRPTLKHKLTSKVGHLHARDHAIGSAIVFLIISLSIFIVSKQNVIFSILLFAILDYGLHFFIDWLKNNFKIANNWDEDSREYWILTTIDQILHTVTYLSYVIIFDIYFF